MVPYVTNAYKRYAHLAVRQAIKRGELPPINALTCVDCGAPAKHYDHRNYDIPLDVVPTCHSCNLKRGPGAVSEATVAAGIARLAASKTKRLTRT